MFKSEDIFLGFVAYIDVSKLLDDRIVKPASPPDRSGPFVCIKILNDESQWTHITTIFREERLALDQYKLGGSSGSRWVLSPQYLNDGSSVYFGPTDLFVKAAANSDNYWPHNRPKITPPGVEKILLEVEKRLNGTEH